MAVAVLLALVEIGLVVDGVRGNGLPVYPTSSKPMTTNQLNRLDRLEALVEGNFRAIERNTANIERNTADIARLTVDIQALAATSQRQQQSIQSLATVAQTQQQTLQATAIRGLRAEKHRILTYLFGEPEG